MTQKHATRPVEPEARTRPDREPLDLENTDFFSLLAHAANEQKSALVTQLLELVRQGDASAMRLLERSLIDRTPIEEKNKPIPILGGITQKHEAL